MRTVHVHAREGLGALVAVPGPEAVLCAVPGDPGALVYLTVLKALELAAAANEAVVVTTSVKWIPQQLSHDKCKSDATRPMYELARDLMLASGSRVAYEPSADNPAVTAVWDALRTVPGSPTRYA